MVDNSVNDFLKNYSVIDRAPTNYNAILIR